AVPIALAFLLRLRRVFHGLLPGLVKLRIRRPETEIVERASQVHEPRARQIERRLRPFLRETLRSERAEIAILRVRQLAGLFCVQAGTRSRRWWPGGALLRARERGETGQRCGDDGARSGTPHRSAHTRYSKLLMNSITGPDSVTSLVFTAYNSDKCE